VAWYQGCWDAFNTKELDRLKTCYGSDVESEMVGSGAPVDRGPDAVDRSTRGFVAAFPDARGNLQLVLLNDRTLASLAVLTGTHTGPLGGPDGTSIPATNKPIGLFQGHVAELNDTGDKVVRERWYMDSPTMMAQLGLNPAPARPVATPGTAAPLTVIAQATLAEAANVEGFQAQTELFNKHDANGAGAYNAADVVIRDVTQAKDLGAADNVKMLEGYFKAFPDARLVLTSVWGAGDYVVAEGTFEGTNTGPAPQMGIKKATGKPVQVRFLEIIRFADGKVKEDWLLFDSMAFATQLGLTGAN
jgi:predicted ester cyclase